MHRTGASADEDASSLHIPPSVALAGFTPLLTAEQVAQIIAVNVDRVYELIRRGILPAAHLGRKVRISPRELRAWLNRGGMALAPGLPRPPRPRSATH